MYMLLRFLNGKRTVCLLTIVLWCHILGKHLLALHSGLGAHPVTAAGPVTQAYSSQLISPCQYKHRGMGYYMVEWAREQGLWDH